ncbi:hypothetical protein ACROYT_G022380 [Oculina patagonica]
MNQDEVSGSQMTSEDSIDEAPSLADVWKVLTEIKSNTEKLKVNYKELQENLASTKAQVDILVKENKGLKSKVKSLEDDLSKSKEYSKEMEQRLDDIKARPRLCSSGAREDEDNLKNVIELGGDIDVVHRMNTKFIVRFASYNTKNKLYKARLYLRNVTLQDLGPGEIFYINENLTSWRADLFKECISVNGSLSSIFNLECGVQQGFCLGPFLFTLYTSRLFDIIQSHLPEVHCFADDTQLYLSFSPSNTINQLSAISAMESCVDDIRSWMLTDSLKLNDDK